MAGGGRIRSKTLLLLFLAGGRGRGGLSGGRFGGALLELVHAPSGVYELLLAGVKRMAGVADADENGRLGGFSFDHVAAGATDFRIDIFRMNVSFHTTKGGELNKGGRDNKRKLVCLPRHALATCPHSTVEHAYHFVGQDGQTYGPVSLADLRIFVADGRVPANGFVIRDDQTDWTTVAACPELNPSTPTVGGPPRKSRKSVGEILEAPARAVSQHREWYTEELPMGLLRERSERGAQMLMWVSALAAAVYLFWYFGAQHIPMSFITSKAGPWTLRIAGKASESLSLATPMLVKRLVYGYVMPPVSFQAGSRKAPPPVFGPRSQSWLYNKWVMMGMDLVSIGIFAVLSVFAKERKMWAFIAGLALYTVDFGLCAYYKNWWAMGFHLLPATFIVLGLRANWRLLRG